MNRSTQNTDIIEDVQKHRELCTKNHIIMIPVRTDNRQFYKIEVLYNNEKIETTEPLNIDCDEYGFSPYFFTLCQLYRKHYEKLMKKEEEKLYAYEYTQKHKGIKITNYLGSNKKVVIPNKIDNQPVVAIGKSAFRKKDLEQVTIPPSVKKIGIHAFSENELEQVTIPPSVKVIKLQVFSMNRLKKITIPPSVKKIKTLAFASNELEQVTIPPSVKKIGEYAFTLNKLKQVTIQSSIKIKESLFNEKTEIIREN